MGGAEVKHARFCGRGKQHFMEMLLRYGRETFQLAGEISGDTYRTNWLLKLLCICVILFVKKELNIFAADLSSLL